VFSSWFAKLSRIEIPNNTIIHPTNYQHEHALAPEYRKGIVYQLVEKLLSRYPSDTLDVASMQKLIILLVP
jgi:hypothetical protein